MTCEDIDYGTCDCSYHIFLPYPNEKLVDGKLEFKCVDIDKCLLSEVVGLWELGIKTTGCCCGHKKSEPFISVRKEYGGIMLHLGYEIQHNMPSCDINCYFVPKSKLYKSFFEFNLTHYKFV